STPGASDSGAAAGLSTLWVLFPEAQGPPSRDGAGAFLAEDPLAPGSAMGHLHGAVTWDEAAAQLLPAGAGFGAAPGDLARAPKGRAATFGNAGEAPGTGQRRGFPPPGQARRLAGPSPLRFDPATGVLAIRGEGAIGGVREAVDPAGFLE